MSRPRSLRLDRLLANLGYGSRREANALVRDGLATLDGRVLTDSAEHVPLTPDLSQRLRIDGAPLDPLPPLTLILHKPLGVVCSHREAGRSVYELLPSRWRRREPPLSTIGRLDADTTGLLLITDDGALLHRIISPKNHVPKAYLADLARPLEGHEAALFASGTLVLEGETTPLAPAQLEPLEANRVRLIITEGRYHQVRRMFAAAGNHVERLHRERIGGLPLPQDLEPGRFAKATAEDLASLFSDSATAPP
ncbi:MAG TPA: pseudouridine synthase [Caulobacteraceae bacterium]|nr:pseudouridine synthase [Caulobacteraceae bacterium]